MKYNHNYPYSRHSVILISPLRLNYNGLPANLARFITDTSLLCPFHPENQEPTTLTHIFFIVMT